MADFMKVRYGGGMFYNLKYRIWTGFLVYTLLMGIALIEPLVALYLSVPINFIIFGFYNLSHDKKLFILFGVIIAFVFNHLNFSAISGPDETYFYTSFLYEDFLGVILSELNRLENQVGFISSRNTYPAFLSLVIPFKNESFIPELIFILNSAVWFLAVSYYLESLRSYVDKKALNLSFVFLCLSPSVLYWMTNFGKDIIVISFCMLSASFYLNKKMLKCILFILLASALRPYAVILVISFIIPFHNSMRLVVLYTSTVLTLFMLIVKVNFASLMNTLIVSVFLFLSPNPFSSDNWSVLSAPGVWHHSPVTLTLEGVFIGVCLLFSVFYFCFMAVEKKQLLLKIALATYAIAIVMTLVGQLNILGAGNSVGIGSLGDNFIRKKLVAWPLIMIFLSISLSYINLGRRSTNNKGFIFK